MKKILIIFYLLSSASSFAGNYSVSCLVGGTFMDQVALEKSDQRIEEDKKLSSQSCTFHMDYNEKDKESAEQSCEFDAGNEKIKIIFQLKTRRDENSPTGSCITANMNNAQINELYLAPVADYNASSSHYNVW